ncbi:uncharacterized protein LAESUDRAFT_681133 [Laetiporus sulphureus 93-53]|uniref:Coenzyme Q-binding protein COQ10 START domain-containing protein n=1 Tax=Laetiporus sulphureus 93-53 TaxID=1314785 RepID=A0A165DTK0_9APHY|nr:uncharacterized protein LAESUDRAFT_681133 [Laetiporus sulphureus 93-53]KZT05605.1 hypothetical protein LAESUDRAFT_681133 [Laetiporus sulphureus 93-53]
MLPLVRLASRCNRLPTQRSFFTLPDLSSLSPFPGSNGDGHDRQTYHERKILPYKPSELYNVVADVDSYPHFLPFCTAARVLERKPATDNAPGTMRASMTVGFLSFQESYVSDVTYRPNELLEIAASESTPLFKTLNTIWRFQPASPNSPHPSSKPPLSVTSPTPDLPAQPESPDDRDSGPTLVTLDLSFSFANPVHAAVSAAFFGQVSKVMVKAFEERCLDTYGPGRR